MTSPPAEWNDATAAALFEKTARDLASGAGCGNQAAIEAALAQPLSPGVAAQLANLLTHLHFAAKRFPEALAACRTWQAAAPGDSNARNSLLSILTRLGRFEDVAAEASARVVHEPDDPRLRGALAQALGRLGDDHGARAHGQACLQLKDRLASAPARELGAIPVPKFDPAAPTRNVIAFSLFGRQPSYRQGAIRNALAARFVYPEWTCRFYVDDSVPQPVVDRLAQLGAQVRSVTGLPAQRFGTFWRFLVADDPDVDRYLVRDCDACVNLRERAAVQGWIAGDRHFHLMRDGYTHVDVMLAGMWGAVRGAAPPMAEAIVAFAETGAVSRTADQQFLLERIWPMARQSVLAHDSWFSFGGAVDFPPRAAIPGLTVGQATSEPFVGRY